MGKRHHDEKIHSGMQTNIFGIFFGIFKASEDPRSMMRKRGPWARTTLKQGSL